MQSSATPQTPDAIDVFNSGRYRLAYALLRERAQTCDPWAQNYLGIMYHLGLGQRSDATSAARWYLESANAGNADAQRNLAILYSSGLGLSQDFFKAYGWLFLAGAMGNSSANAALDAMSDKLTANQIMRAKSWADKYRKVLVKGPAGNANSQISQRRCDAESR